MTDPFRVIIVGGGIGGLALANSLQHAGIDYRLIEKREALDLPQGASVGILPNGARLLDQLGCYDELTRLCVGMESTATLDKEGGLIGNVSETLKLMEIRTGYEVFFLDRQWLLRIMADRLRDHSKVLLGRTVQAVEQDDAKATVTLDDGSTIEGDMVIGADGTYSTVRQEMARHASLAGETDLFQQDQSAMSAEYKCMFGISESVTSMTPSQTFRTYAPDLSTLAYVGKDSRVFWFVFAKMDHTYKTPHLPRFSDDDAATMVRQIGSLKIQPDPAVTVEDLYKARVACNLVSIEEAEYKHWSYGRLVCVGDACHKMTPNLGAGAASAIEDAAVLSNMIVDMAAPHTTTNTTKPSIHTIKEGLRAYQEEREPRALGAMRFSNALTRVQALKGFREWLYTHHIAPRMDDFAADMFSDFVIGAPLIKHLPVPERSLGGTMPFNPRHGWVYKEKKGERMKWAAPLVVLGAVYAALRYLEVIPGWGERKGFEELSWLAEKSCVYMFWILEGSRLNNQGSLIALPWLFTLLAEGVSLPLAAGLHFFLLYGQSPVENFRASDNRLINVTYAGWATLLMLLAIVTSTILPRYISTPDILSNATAQVLLLPAVLLLHRIISSPSHAGTIRHDRLFNVRSDVPHLRRWVGASVVLPAVLHLAVLLRAPGIAVALATESFQVVVLAGIISGWFALVFGDLKKAGMLRSGWVDEGATMLLGMVVLGPGAALVLMWLAREDVLVTRRHKDAVVAEGDPEEKFEGAGREKNGPLV